MIKSSEFTSEQSCLSKAENNEMLFVLLARDPAAPVAIRAWIDERRRLGLTRDLSDTLKLKEAEKCASVMELQRQFPDTYMPLWASRKRAELEKALERR